MNEFVVKCDTIEEFHEVQDYCMKYGSYAEGRSIGFDNWKSENHRNNNLQSFPSYVKYSDYYCSYNYTTNNYPQYPLYTFKEFKTMSENREIIGYKLVKEELEKVVDYISDQTTWVKVKQHRGYYDLRLNNFSIDNFKKASVLDLWFEPVYKEVKKTFSLDSDQGLFNLEVSKDGIYYAPEKNFLDSIKLNELLETKTVEDNNYTYKQCLTHVDLGCKKNVPIKGLQEVLDYFNSVK